MEDVVLDSVGFIGNIDFSFVLRAFFYIYLFFWVTVVIWVWFDASERSSNVLFKIFSVIVTLFFNIFGLLIYLLVRPADSYEERYLSELEKKYLQLETSGLIKCPKCAFDLEPGFIVCPRCGKSVKVKCENCDMHIDSWWGFCAYCGAERDVVQKPKKVEVELEEEEVYIPMSYHLTMKQYLCKIGEKQDRCLRKTKAFFVNALKGSKQEEENVKKVKKSKKNKKKKNK